MQLASPALALSDDTSFTCWVADRASADAPVTSGLSTRRVADLPAGEVLFRVVFASLNYKDALANQGHPGVAPQLPHIPGIDAVGIVETSSDARYKPGDWIIVTGNDFGAPGWGGWSELARVKADWIIPLPKGMSPQEAMALGTAGFTAAQCVLAIQTGLVTPDAGEVLVTGATGGVGCLAVKLLSQLGYQVTAVTGKPQKEEWLRSCGAAKVIGREEVHDNTNRPMLRSRWAAVVDTVGGSTLQTAIRATKNYGVVAACGLVGGTELPLTVHPFILRGITLAGIGSALLPYPRRQEIWRRLSSEWKIANLDSLTTIIPLAEVGAACATILRGEIVGRTVVQVCKNLA